MIWNLKQRCDQKWCNGCSVDEIQQGAKALADVLEIDVPKLQKEKPREAAPVASSACDRCGRVMYDD